MVGLGDFDGGKFQSRAWAINSDGSVIVGHGTTAEGWEAFRWTSNSGMENLNDILTANGVDMDG
ncbi:MAG: hypothetical protein ACNI3A_11950 [Desulfovibrio sp.]|uniref:hypothetical protein n=1 Tax=Desulfovibrio sp. 7SRBS1 TaxID=3378064 RepID=UPI003B410983